jgi:hypothetical protein
MREQFPNPAEQHRKRIRAPPFGDSDRSAVDHAAMSGNAVGARGFPHRRDNSNQLEALGADATVGQLRRDVVPLGARQGAVCDEARVAFPVARVDVPFDAEA